MNDANPIKTKHTALKTGLHAWTLVLAIVILVPSAYGYLYYSNRDTYLTSHYFRTLSEIERQINLGLKGLDHLVDSALVEVNPKVKKDFCPENDKTNLYCEKYRAYLKRYSSTFKHIKFFNASRDCLQEAEKGASSGGSDITCFEITGVVDNRKSTVFQKKDELAAKVPLKDLIDPAPGLKYFNQILLLDRAGNLIYRSGADDLVGTDNYAARDDFSRFENLIHYLTTDESWRLDPESMKVKVTQINRPPSHSTVRDATIGNVTFRLFIQPFHAVRKQYIANPTSTAGASHQSGGKSNTFQAEEIAYLIGVVAEEKYFFDVISLPLGRITMLVFAMLIVVQLMPHMKLFFSGVHFMPNRVFGWWLALSFPLLVTMIMIGVLSANQYVRLRESVDQTATVLGERIAENFGHELSRSIRLVVDRQSTHKQRHDHARMACFLRPGSKGEYPEFEQAFYLNKDGGQVGDQVTFRSFPSSRIKVDKRDYFKRPRFNPETLMVWAGNDGKLLQPYFSERIQTYNHGIKLTAFSFPAPVQLVPECFSKAAELKDKSVVALIKLMHTFFNPVLPAGFGFAVIDDRTGNVWYHSNDQRSLLENFYIESDENDELIAAVDVRHEHFVVGKYNGFAHWFWLQPLEMTPWSLVVFYDTATLELANFKASIYSIAIVGVIVIFLMVGLYVVSVVLKYFGVWHRLERFSPKAIFWAEQKRRRLLHVIRFSTVYLFCVGALLLIVCGAVSKLTFDAVNRDQMELLSRVNLAHIGAKMVERKIALTAEFQRVVARKGVEFHQVVTCKGEKAAINKLATYLGFNLYAFANYATDAGAKDASCPKNKPSIHKRLSWLVTIDETSSECLKDPLDQENGNGLVAWLVAWLSEHLPVLNRADARSRHFRDDHAADGNWRFQPCAADSGADDIAAQFRGNNRQIVQMNGLKAPASMLERGLDGWQWGLYAFFIIVLLYNLIKLTAQRLLGLGFPSVTRWRKMLNRHQSGSPLTMLSFSGRADRKTAESNLNKIAEATSGPLLEFKSILFNLGRERLINTANIAPLMWLINSGILKNRRGNICFCDPAVMEWLQEQRWEKELSAYQAEEQPNLWRILAPPFYAVVLLAFGFLIMSGGQVGDLLLALLPFTLAGGLPFINQLFDKFFRE